MKQSHKNVYSLLKESELQFELQLRQEWVSLAGLTQDAITQDIPGLRAIEQIYNLPSGAVPIFLEATPVTEAAAAATPVTDAEAAAQDVMPELELLMQRNFPQDVLPELELLMQRNSAP